MSKYTFIDIDINDSRAAYKRAAEFVETSSIKYGLSSNSILDLGGREMISLPDLYATDFTWCAKGRMQERPQAICRIIFELDFNNSPLAAENFFHLCKGDKGKGKSSNVPMTYKGSKIHRFVPGFIMQGGDYVFGNGTGGESIFGKKFKDEPKGLKLKHDGKGILSMGNSGKNSNSSQFFITLDTKGAPQCDKKHVVFGKIKHGIEVLDVIAQEHSARAAGAGGSGGDGGGGEGEGGSEESPYVSLVITECGEWDETMPVQGYWAPDDSFTTNKVI